MRGEGCHVYDEQGRSYLDLMSAYSALSHGHAHPRIVAAACDQLHKLSVCSRAFYCGTLGPFLARACELTGMDKALPMNSGAEAVETALKAARKWAMLERGMADGEAQIIVMEGNFHGRTISIISFSSENAYRRGFAPLTDGFVSVPYGDIDALRQAINPRTAAVLLEPIQGEAGIRLPPPGWLAQVRELCTQKKILMLVDEIQTGLGRTGDLLACDHEQVKPDGLMLGKALGGGLLPVSLFLARKDLMDVFTPGDHGSTFGGNPLAARVGLEALNVLMEEHLIDRARQHGALLLAGLKSLRHPALRDVRGRGLFIGMEFDPAQVSARHFCQLLQKEGALSKDTHGTVVRICPPLTLSEEEVGQAQGCIERALAALR